MCMCELYTPSSLGCSSTSLPWCVPGRAGLSLVSSLPVALLPALSCTSRKGLAACSREISTSLAVQTRGSHLLQSEQRVSTQLETRAEELKTLEP